MSLPADPASAAVARRFVRDALAAWGAQEFEDPAVLLTSELVTNALLHARSAPELVVQLVAGHLRVAVTDAVATAPVRKHYGTDAGTGRGLVLIETLADAWGTDPDGDGKVVWFELGPAERGGDTSSTTRFASPTDADNGRAHRSGRPEPGSRRGPPGGPRASARQPRLGRVVRLRRAASRS